LSQGVLDMDRCNPKGHFRRGRDRVERYIREYSKGDPPGR
jgi:hypothetical protein